MMRDFGMGRGELLEEIREYHSRVVVVRDKMDIYTGKGDAEDARRMIELQSEYISALCCVRSLSGIAHKYYGFGDDGEDLDREIEETRKSLGDNLSILGIGGNFELEFIAENNS